VQVPSLRTVAKQRSGILIFSVYFQHVTRNFGPRSLQFSNDFSSAPRSLLLRRCDILPAPARHDFKYLYGALTYYMAQHYKVAYE
jgi:hypothetical protein